jgi:hypothetical protein
VGNWAEVGPVEWGNFILFSFAYVFPSCSPKNIFFMNFVHTFLVGHRIEKAYLAKNAKKGA